MRSVLLYQILLKWLCFSGCVLAYGNDDFYGRRYDHYHGKYSDSELMVDVLNNFGLRLLMAHNEHNENNIAFSPYGIGVILMALGEGLRGEALYEIRKAIYLPYDAHTIRVGLRDIHRHLKSYFIPKEGFLAGITLNSENVSINPQYIQLLKFYGYDIHSFNTALYPESHITTTESELMGGREETTVINNEVTDSTMTPESTTEKSDEEKITSNTVVLTTSVTESITETTEAITEGEDKTTTIKNQVSVMSTTDSSSDTSSTQTTDNSETTTSRTEAISQGIGTEMIGNSATETPGAEATETTMASTATSSEEDIMDVSSAASSESEGPITEDFETSSLTISTFSTTISEDVETQSPPEVTTEQELNASTDDSQSSTTEVTTSLTPIESVQPSSISYSSEETTQLYTSVTSTPASNGEESEFTTSTTTSEEIGTTTSKVRKVRSSEESTDVTNEDDELTLHSPSEVLEAVDYEKKSDETVERIRAFGSNDWSIKINNQIKLLNPNDASTPGNSVGAIINNERRIPRSIEEYVITRFYHYNNFRPTKPYEPNETLFFFVNEKNMEAGLDFMTYDTVLPFLFIPNPSAMALAFPLDSDKYYLLLMLPSEDSALDDLICKLYMHNTFKYILNNLELTHVKVTIPSFSLSGRITLTNSLQKLGVRRIFEPRQADFSPMTPTEGVYVTNIEQAVSITIKNNLNIKRDTRHGHHYYSEPIRFNVNRPFLYFVIDSELQIILMTGKVVNPLNVRIK